MNPTSSVAQFMALLGGNQNANAALRSSQTITSNGEIDFEALLAGLGTEVTGQNNAGKTNVNAQASLATLAQNIVNSSTTTNATTQTSATSPLLKLIGGNVANDTSTQENIIALALAQRGASDQIIQEIMANFSGAEIATLLQDHDLNTQLTSLIQQASSNTTVVTDTDTNETVEIISDKDLEILVSSVQKIILEQKNSISDLTFKASDITDEIIEDIIDRDIQPKTEEELAVAAGETPVILKNPVATAQMDDNAQSALSKNQVAGKDFNPFMSRSSDQNSEAESPSSRLERALNGVAPSQGNKPEYQSIADRVSAQATSHANANAAFNADSFNVLTASGGDNAFLNADADLMASSFEASFKTASQASNSLINTSAAGQNHPATQTVAISLTKLAQNGKTGETDRYRLQLDPPEMGRLDIEMDFQDTGKIKAIITVDEPETLKFLQRDANALIKAMQDAGFDNMSHNDLSFTLSQDNNAGGQDNNGRNGHHNATSDYVEGDLEVIETEMSVIIDPVTGQKHVNMLV